MLKFCCDFWSLAVLGTTSNSYSGHLLSTLSEFFIALLSPLLHTHTHIHTYTELLKLTQTVTHMKKPLDKI